MREIEIEPNRRTTKSHTPPQQRSASKQLKEQLENEAAITVQMEHESQENSIIDSVKNQIDHNMGQDKSSDKKTLEEQAKLSNDENHDSDDKSIRIYDDDQRLSCSEGDKSVHSTRSNT